MENTTGDRIRNARKLAGMTQRELARAAGLSVSAIRDNEQGVGAPRLATLRKMAAVLHVPTSSLATADSPENLAPGSREDWADVRRALYHAAPQPDEPVSAAAVMAALDEVKPDLAANRYAAVRPLLPGLITDAFALDGPERFTPARTRVLNLAAWLLTQTRQWDTAETAVRLAIDAAQDRLDAAAAVNTLCWSLLRQGRLAEARDLAEREAAEIEPRFSRASPQELAAWGRLQLGVTNAAIRDNRPGEAAGALLLARLAADRIGREVVADGSTTRTFGPVTVAMIAGENAAIAGHPDTVLAVAASIPVPAPGDPLRLTASRCRHQLDVANAHVMKRSYPEARATLMRLYQDAPEWFRQQRYARDIIASLVSKRKGPSARETRFLARELGMRP